MAAGESLQGIPKLIEVPLSLSLVRVRERFVDDPPKGLSEVAPFRLQQGKGRA
jgi:hypothetical protein